MWRLDQWFSDRTPATLELLGRYQQELLRFNARINLISRGTEPTVDEVHFADAVLAARAIGPLDITTPLYDLGSGNGIPGLVFGILTPDLTVELVESDSRKVEFLKHVIHLLKLPNVRTRCARVESLPARSVFLSVNRGFAAIDRTLSLLDGIVPAAGLVYHLKGSGWADEMAQSAPIHDSKWDSRVAGTYALPASGVERAIVSSQRR